jgi:hypothetical protein
MPEDCSIVTRPTFDLGHCLESLLISDSMSLLDLPVRRDVAVAAGIQEPPQARI